MTRCTDHVDFGVTRGIYASIASLAVALVLGVAPGSARGAPPQVIDYQGRISVGDIPFSGTGRFKFALVDAGGAVSFWSNDGTSVAGSEPSSFVELAVINGLFAAPLGDTALPNMTLPIGPSTVDHGQPQLLRVWFDDRVNGFERLSPDQPLRSVPFALQAASLDVSSGDSIHVSGEGPYLARTDVHENVPGNLTELFREDLQWGDPDAPRATTVPLRFRISQVGPPDWKRIDTVFNLDYNRQGGGCVNPEQHCVADSWEFDYNAAGTGFKSWFERNLSVIEAGEVDSPRYYSAAINASDGLASFVWSVADDDTANESGDADSIDGWRVGCQDRFCPGAILGDANLNFNGALSIKSEIAASGFSSANGLAVEPAINDDSSAVLSSGGPMRFIMVSPMLTISDPFDQGQVVGVDVIPMLDFGSQSGNTINKLLSFNASPRIDSGSGDLALADYRGFRSAPFISGENTVITTMADIEILRPGGADAPVPENHYGIWIQNLAWYDTGDIPIRAATFRVAAQTPLDVDPGSYGNFQWEGFNWNNGHFQFGSKAPGTSDHFWRDQTQEVFRVKVDGAPAHAADGSELLTADRETTDPCGGKPEAHVFYNDSSDFFCFCTGAGAGVQLHAPASACF